MSRSGVDMAMTLLHPTANGVTISVSQERGFALTTALYPLLRWASLHLSTPWLMLIGKSAFYRRTHPLHTRFSLLQYNPLLGHCQIVSSVSEYPVTLIKSSPSTSIPSTEYPMSIISGSPARSAIKSRKPSKSFSINSWRVT